VALQIGDPEAVRGRRREVALHEIVGTRRGLVALRGEHLLAPHHAAQAFCAHQAFDRSAGDALTLPAQLMGVVLALVLEDQAHGPLPDFLGVPRLSVHGSILSRSGASNKAGAVHREGHNSNSTNMKGGPMNGVRSEGPRDYGSQSGLKSGSGEPG